LTYVVDSLVVIRFGKLMYAGSLDELTAEATERVVAAPVPSAPSSFASGVLCSSTAATGWGSLLGCFPRTRSGYGIIAIADRLLRSARVSSS
jgi:hypothetical protein